MCRGEAVVCLFAETCLATQRRRVGLVLLNVRSLASSITAAAFFLVFGLLRDLCINIDLRFLQMRQ